MPTQFEDTQAGATDISGQPDPVRTPKQVGDQQRKEKNQNERRPQAQPKQGGKNPLQQAADDAGGAVGKGVEGAGKWIQQQGFAPPTKSLNPVDWANEMKQDASVPWGWGRQAYKTLSGDYYDGVHGLFAGDNAYDKVGRQVAGFLADSIPLVGLQESFSDLQSLEAEREGKITDEQRKQEEEQHGEQAVQGAPGTAAMDLSVAAPGGRLAQMAAGVGIPLVQSLLAGTEDQDHALAWAAFGSILSFAHLSEPVRKVLMDHFGDVSAFEAVARAVDKKTNISRIFMDPEKRWAYVEDWIGEQLSRGAMPASSKVVARAKAAGEPDLRTVEVGARDVIKLLPSEEKATTMKLLNRIGVEDVDELVHKAQTEGINDPKIVKAIQQNWKALGIPYDLQRFYPSETPLRDPRIHLDEVADVKAGQQHISAINHYLDQIHRGLFANHSNPMTAVLRALAGHSRATTLTHQQWMSSVVRLLGKEALTEAAQAKLMQAAEGDQDVYQALRPEEKMVVDSWGLLRAAAREESKGTDYAKNFVPNWVPRRDMDVEGMLRGPGRPSTASVLAREARLHREESLQAGPGGQLVLGQRFKTVQDTNKALAEARKNLIAQLTDSGHKLSAELENDPEAKAIHALSADDPTTALERAKTLAAQKYADKDANFLKNVNAAFSNQVRAVHTQQALNEFTQMLARDGKAAAIKLRPGAQRQREEFLRQGYRQVDDPRFQGFVFHPDLASNLGRYVSHVKEPVGAAAKAFDAMLKLEGKIVSLIMYSPLVHGLNVAGRMGIAGLMHPIQMAHYLKEGKAILPHQWDEVSWAKRARAYNGGLVPHYRGKSYADNALGNMSDALGDTEDHLPSMDKPDSWKTRLESLHENVTRPHRAVNNYFWGLVNDFGVMMFHIEEASALRAGMEPEAAMEWAGRRANTWMGVVAPEDTNPMLHNLSRLVMFAPNWWRTWGELMVPYYKRAGFTGDAAYRKFAAYQSGKTIAAALMWQKMTGNALNLMLSGHLQHDNQPGNQDRLEITNPAVLGALRKGGFYSDNPNDYNYVDDSGQNPRTGARATVENPFTRQQQATEMAMGLQSGHPDYKPEDTWDGLTKFLAARSSPLLSSVMALGNVDLYQSIADHQLRGVDPTTPAGQISPGSLLAGAMMATPVGMNFSLQRGASGGGATPQTQSALGTQIPSPLMQALQDIGSPMQKAMFTWVTGVNAPYATAQHSRGIKPSDQDYQRATQLTNDYRQQMQVLSAEALSGQMTPYQWRSAYADLSRQHAAQMEALFKNSPDYVNGGQGLASQWENLYQQATKADGTLDQDQLAVLQAQFQEDHTPEQLQQMHAVLSQNDSRFPMLALYHKAQANYQQWQEQWATENNVDIRQLRRDIAGHSALYGDPTAGRKYLQEHRDVSAYEKAKRNQFEKTLQGVTYEMFYGNNAAVSRYLRSQRITASELAAQEASA